MAANTAKLYCQSRPRLFGRRRSAAHVLATPCRVAAVELQRMGNAKIPTLLSKRIAAGLGDRLVVVIDAGNADAAETLVLE